MVLQSSHKAVNEAFLPFCGYFVKKEKGEEGMKKLPKDSLLLEVVEVEDHLARLSKYRLMIDGQKVQKALDECSALFEKNVRGYEFKDIARAACDVEDIINESLDKSNFACKKGCGSCCTQLVCCTEPEMDLIADYILSLSKKERKKIISIASKKIKDIQIDNLEMLYKASDEQLGIPCMYIDQTKGECMIYPARPVVCRGYRAKQCTRGESIWYAVYGDLGIGRVLGSLGFGLVALPTWPLLDEKYSFLSGP